MSNKFYTKSGWLTTYAMACGYRHETELGNTHLIFLANNISLNTFDVITYVNGQQQSLETIEGLQYARSVYIKACKNKPSTRFETAVDIARTAYA